ncbi:thiosulfate sulfurtransferase [Geothrix limicola]|uniref:Thiosulfate sulfurtransferase n=1 Tax=Geothrix limicola TaxID=2927978 RepID=A0ABQ5QGU0_9BACT|nr:sulfurtransferase [Geothrix limicola]GLH73789.1 thiosulfate sulfurtransferase [Geothrix limicola]
MSLITASDLRTRHTSLRLLDARPDLSDYLAGHLPGALHADLNRQLSTAADPGHDPARGGRHPLPPLDRFATQLGAWGIGPDTEVVVYDAASGGNAAARLWWMLKALGHARVSVLDGGLQAALQDGWTLTVEMPSISPLAAYPAERWLRPTADMEAVEVIRRDATQRLLDVRAPERWRGDSETLDPIAGHIPGSLNLAWNDNLDGSGRFKAPELLRAQYEALLGGVPAERLTVHCGSGVTACHTLLALEVAGLRGASLYVGSWSEWCRSGRERSPEAKPELKAGL